MNSANSALVLMITVGTEQEAHRIAELLVNANKAACVNIVPRVDSLFRWKGKIESVHERLLLVKTRASLLPEIIDLVKQVHSYEVPEIITLPIVDGSKEYLNWLDTACQ